MKCSLCNNIIKGYGHDPRPVKDTSEGNTCDNCHVKTVLPARFQQSKFKTDLKKVKR